MLDSGWAAEGREEWDECELWELWQVRLPTARGATRTGPLARPTEVGVRGRMELVEAGPILRMVLDFGFLIWVIGKLVISDLENLVAVGYRELP